MTPATASATQPISIYPAITAQDMTAACALMIEYRDTSLGEDYDVGGNSLNEELAQFPGPYAPPRGLLFLASDRNTPPCGCLALRPIGETIGEVMRMYVQPAARGQGIAEALMRRIIIEARALGYHTLYLDSLKRFEAAHKLYEKFGFTYCAPYDPLTTDAMKDRMIFMQRTLA